MSTYWKAIIAITIASIFWGSAGIVGKILLRSFSPFEVAFLRSCVASLFMIPIFLKQKRVPVKRILIDIVPIAALSAINIVFYYIGLQWTTVNASAVMYAATPLLVALISSITIHEHVSVQQIVGVIVGFIGVLSIILLPALGHPEVGFGTPIGNLLLLVAVTSWSFYIVGSRYLTNTKKYQPLTVTAVSMFVSVVLLGFINLFAPHHGSVQSLLQPNIIVNLLYLGFFVTVITYTLFQWAMQHVSSTNASLTNYLQPIFAFYFAWIFLSEHITFIFLIGSILVLLGVFLVTGEKMTAHARALRGRRRNG